MRHTVKLGWAFFALCCLIVTAYSLNKGIYVGHRSDERLGLVFITECHYLYPSGILKKSPSDTVHSCRLFGPD
jgi:hypothetical protein